jgi:uronate dehydrogenase
LNDHKDRKLRLHLSFQKTAATMLNPPVSSLRFSRLLLTGAAGALGCVLRPRLKRYCDTLRLSDIAELSSAQEGEEIVQAPLEDAMRVKTLLEGIGAVVHLGGVSTEKPWASIIPANIMGVVNLYEAARLNGVKRIVFASSNHAIGFYRQSETIDNKVLPKPDGFYGLSKAFGENCAQLYWDRWGIETVSLRIGSSFPEPKDRRMLSTWLSYDDLERLVVAALTAPQVGHTIVYGMSNNRAVFWDNAGAKHIGFQPQDCSEPFRATIEAKQPTINRNDPAATYQGGAFVAAAPHG